MFGIHHNTSDRKGLNVLVHIVSYLLVQYTIPYYFVLLRVYLNPAKCLNVLHQLHSFKKRCSNKEVSLQTVSLPSEAGA